MKRPAPKVWGLWDLYRVGRLGSETEGLQCSVWAECGGGKVSEQLVDTERGTLRQPNSIKTAKSGMRLRRPNGRPCCYLAGHLDELPRLQRPSERRSLAPTLYGGDIGDFGGGRLEIAAQWLGPLGAQWAGLCIGVPSCSEPPGAP